MKDADRVKHLKLALRVVAAVFVLGVYPLTIVWPSGWAWHPGPGQYSQMIERPESSSGSRMHPGA